MSAVSKEAGGSNQDFDLNIAPIIDCFTVLITYLLVSASFISLNVLDIGVAASGEAPAETVPAEPPVMFSLEISAAKLITLKVSGGAEGLDLSFPIAPAANGEWNVVGALAKVTDSMSQWPTV